VTLSLNPLILCVFRQWRRRFDDLLAVTEVSLDDARRLGDRHNEAKALNNLGLRPGLGGSRAVPLG
jgi:hypothetical protein